MKFTFRFTSAPPTVYANKGRDRAPITLPEARPVPARLPTGFRSTHPNTKCNFKLQLGVFFSFPTNPVPLLAAGQACLDGVLIPSEEFIVLGEPLILAFFVGEEADV